jgi:small subunit ribosomal protein S31
VKTNEEKVGFEEHVLLDHHLKDFPQRGPVRRFMEMVVTGLSKNPYYTVKEKHQQIQWYKKYFSKFSPEDLQGAALGVDFHPTNPEKEYQGKSEPRKTDKKRRTSSSK